MNSNIVVDGQLDEPIWQSVEPLREFTQTEPNEGAPTTERTEVRIVYDDKKIYFGFDCYDREPKKIVARLDRHDARTNSDSVDILLDTYHDLRTAYFFSVNAFGVQFDATVSESTGRGVVYDGTWDAVWESQTTVDERGWHAEIAIPFKELRFSSAREQVWGINVGRSIVRKNESARWVPVLRFDGSMRPSKSGLLVGIESIESGHNLDFLPFLTARQSNFNRAVEDERVKSSSGLDVRYGFTPNLILNATFNPDFGQTEADEFNVSLSRFELFFPEKRAFFNEGANTFRTPFQLFFTRRIGAVLPDGNAQRIQAGVKLTGKVGNYQIGFLEAKTENQSFYDADEGRFRVSPGANFFVLRVQRDLFQKSSIGFITVNRDQTNNDFSHTQRAHGVDLNLVHGAHITWSSQLAIAQNPGLNSQWHQKLGLSSGFNYNSDQQSFRINFFNRGRDFLVDQIGFEPQNDRYGGAATYVWKPRIEKYFIRQIFIEPNYDYVYRNSGALDDAGADLQISAQLQNFWRVEARYSYDRVRFNEFTPLRERLDAERLYVTPKYRFRVETNSERPVSGSFQYLARTRFVNFPENFLGRDREWSFGLNVRMAGRSKIEMSGTLFQEYFLDGTRLQNRGVALVRWGHQFTRKLRTRILTQYTERRDRSRWGVNALAAYDFNSRSALYIGYNSDKLVPFDPVRSGREFFIKLSYLFSF